MSVEALFALLFVLFHVLADPDVTVESEDEIHSTGKRDEVRLQSTDQDRRHGDELPIPELGSRKT